MGFLAPLVPLIAGAFGSAGAAAGASTALTVASAGIGAVSSVVGGIAARNAANYQAQVATNNATTALNNKNSALEAGAVAEGNQQLKTDRLIASQQVGYAANGVDVGVGSPQDVLGSTRREGDLDALMVRYNAARQGAAYQAQSDNFTAQAAIYRASGKNSMIQGILGAGSSLIGGAKSLTNNALSFKQVGLGDSAGLKGLY